MADDFLNTALRMRDDSRLLLNSNKNYNACYLAGYVAECYAKYILVSLVNNHRSGNRYSYSEVKRLFSHDIEMLMNEICTTSTQIPSSCRIDFRQQSTAMWNPSSRWNPYDRYGNNPDWENETVAQTYVQEANDIYEHLLRLILVEGVLPL